MDTLSQLASKSNLHLNSHEFATYLDNTDTGLRDEFCIPTNTSTNQQQIYLVANLTGLQPKRTKKLVNEELDVWANQGLSAYFTHPFNRNWASMDKLVTKQMCQLVGAKSETEIAIMGSITNNIHLLLVPFYRPTSKRYKVLVESHSFCTCLYAIESQIKFHGYDPKLGLLTVMPTNGYTITTQDFENALAQHADEICLCLFSGVQYYTGQLFDMQKITAVCHSRGIVVGWDLAHAIGNVELHAHDWDLDFAVWCSYKYLNSGPGGIGGLFVHEKHHAELCTKYNRFAGWWGHDESTRFLMPNTFVASPGAQGLELSCPGMMAVICLIASMQVFGLTNMSDLRQRSIKLTSYLEYLLNELVFNSGCGQFSLITPVDVNQRGAQLSVQLIDLDSVAPIIEILKAHNVIVGSRQPNVLSITPSPLYNTFAELRQFVDILLLCLRKASGQ